MRTILVVALVAPAVAFACRGPDVAEVTARNAAISWAIFATHALVTALALWLWRRLWLRSTILLGWLLTSPALHMTPSAGGSCGYSRVAHSGIWLGCCLAALSYAAVKSRRRRD